MNKTDLMNAARLIHDYCEKSECSGCPFKDDEDCRLQWCIPSYWALEDGDE